MIRLFRPAALGIALALGATGLTAAPVAPAREPEVTGTFDDAGTIAVAPPGDPLPVVSLHALLTAQFIPGVARLVHEETGEVRLTHTAGQLKAEITNHDGEVAWERTWREGEDYWINDARVALYFKGARERDDSYLLLLESVTTYKLLQVEVQRHTPTLLGRRIEPMGVYLFPRLE